MAHNSILEELRRERQKRYETLADDAKPRVEPCIHCHKPPYEKRVCPITGICHDHGKHRIVGGCVVGSNIISSSELMEAFERSRVRWSPSQLRVVRVDATSLNLFQSFARQKSWKLQRCGFLYGRYDSATLTTEVHAVYEPAQEGSAVNFSCLRDEHIEMVDQMAERLGFRRVGMICTHQARDPDKMVLSGRELLYCAREQSRFGDGCVLLTMSPDSTTGHVECQAWQASPQAVHFYSLGVLSDRAGVELCNSCIATGVADEVDREDTPRPVVYSSIPLEVAEEQRDAKGHPMVVTKAASEEVDTRWFTSYVAVEQFDSPVVKNLFARLSRPGMQPPMISNLQNYLEDSKRSGMTMLQKLADFHVLVYLTCSVFSGTNEVFAIIDAIKGGHSASSAELHMRTIQLLMEGEEGQ